MELEKRLSVLESTVANLQEQIILLNKAVFKEKVMTQQTVYHTIQSLLNAKQAPTLALIASALKVDKMYVVEILAKNSQHIRYSNKNQIEELLAIKHTKDVLFKQGKLFYIEFIDYGQKKIVKINNSQLFNQLAEDYISHSYGDRIVEKVISATPEVLLLLSNQHILNGSDDTIDWEKQSEFLWQE